MSFNRADINTSLSSGRGVENYGATTTSPLLYESSTQLGGRNVHPAKLRQINLLESLLRFFTGVYS